MRTEREIDLERRLDLAERDKDNLLARIYRLETALRPFAERCDEIESEWPNAAYGGEANFDTPIAWMRFARAIYHHRAGDEGAPASPAEDGGAAERGTPRKTDVVSDHGSHSHTDGTPAPILAVAISGDANLDEGVAREAIKRNATRGLGGA